MSKSKIKKQWLKWFDRQSAEDRRTIAIAAIERLMETEDISFRVDDSVNIDGTPIPDDEVVDECLYWTSCGENLLDSEEA